MAKFNKNDVLYFFESLFKKKKGLDHFVLNVHHYVLWIQKDVKHVILHYVIIIRINVHIVQEQFFKLLTMITMFQYLNVVVHRSL